MSAEGAAILAASQKHSFSGRQRRPRVSQEDRRRAIRACDSCRRQKEKCEGGVPCRRCSRLHRICQFHMSSNSGGNVSTDEVLVRPVAASNGSGSREKIRLMERIIKHQLGDVPCDTQSLSKIIETLEEADGRLLDSNNADDMDDSEELPITDQEFTVTALSNNAAHYSGEYSHWSFSKRVLDRVGKLSAGTDLTDLQSENIQEFYRARQLQSSGPTILMLRQYFPPQPVSEYLISTFFKYGQTNYYYVEKDWALAKLESLYSETSNISSDDSPACCILLMLLAIGTQFADLDSAQDVDAGLPPEPSASHDIATGDDVGLTLYKAAAQLIPDVITIASIESVQAFLLLGVYTLPLDTPGVSYTYLGVAIKMAIQNGMHRKHPALGLDLRTTEIRNRLWWTVYTLEKRICVLHGRPVSISQSDTDAQLPSDLPEFRPTGQPANFTNLLAMINLTIQLESIAASIVKLRNSERTVQADRLQELVQHSQKLRDWWSKLPDDIYCRDLDPMKGMFRANIHLHLNFLLTQVFLGRPFLFSYSKKYASPDRPIQSTISNARYKLTISCVEAAFKILDLCQLLYENGGLARASYTEFSSCRAAMLVFLAHSLNEGTERLRTALTKGMKLMRLMARVESAKSELSVIESLERAVKHLDGHSKMQSFSTSNESRQSSGYEKYKTWAQLWKHSPRSPGGLSDSRLENAASANSHNVGDELEVPVASDPSGLGFEECSPFPRASEVFFGFPMTNEPYQQNVGVFSDMGLEQSWQGYQIFDYNT
ncbi:hypothetical protein DL98DRAFT_481750 [Cadophora sp. DSE1049]|nr:hypothetical protein DL98DRAFT_481750 [Cadophora sp. DSE1049]